FVALAETIRAALVARFGPSWRAKTKEELSNDHQLEEVLGPDLLPELMRFLDQVDTLKFSLDQSNHEPDALEQAMAAWEPRITPLRARIGAKPPNRPAAKKAGSPAEDRRRTAPFEAGPS